jgi:ribonuclease HI
MYADGEIVKRHSRYLGKATNNQAEYRGVIDALEHAREMGAKEIDLVMDSELVVKQLNREYRVKDKDLAQLFVQVWNLTLGFSRFTVRHVRREQNKEADKLVNEAIDRGIREGR